MAAADLSSMAPSQPERTANAAALGGELGISGGIENFRQEQLTDSDSDF